MARTLARIGCEGLVCLTYDSPESRAQNISLTEATNEPVARSESDRRI